MGGKPRARTAPDGIVVIDKPAGMTSHDVVGMIRRRFSERRVGHAFLDLLQAVVVLVEDALGLVDVAEAVVVVAVTGLGGTGVGIGVGVVTVGTIGYVALGLVAGDLGNRGVAVGIGVSVEVPGQGIGGIGLVIQSLPLQIALFNKVAVDQDNLAHARPHQRGGDIGGRCRDGALDRVFGQFAAPANDPQPGDIKEQDRQQACIAQA